MRSSKKLSLNFISLFCGCGGFDLGFTQSGFQCHGAFDIDSLAVKNHQANLGVGAITQNLEDGCNTLSLPKKVDVLIAGPPCQGFSTAGKRNLDDPRNHLLLTAGKIALQLKPRVFIVENVRGVVSGGHRKYWDDLCEMLRGRGYQVCDFLCDVSKIGIPQTRKRMIMLAWNTGRNWTVPNKSKRVKTLSDALANINGSPDHKASLLDSKSEFAKIANHIKAGQKLCNVRGGPRSVHTWTIPEVFGKTNNSERRVLEAILYLRRRIRLRNYGDADPVLATDVTKAIGKNSKSILSRLVFKGYVRKIGHRYDLMHTFNGKFRRLRWDKPSATVDTRFIDPRYFLHPEEDRGFTVREAARIQGFPDSFEFYGSEKDQCRLIGNAVPPPLAKWLAECAKQLL